MTIIPSSDHRKPFDVAGREIKVGDIIAYAVSVNSSGVLNIGKVVDLPVHEESYNESNGIDPATKRTLWVRKTRTYSKIKVVPWDLAAGTPEFRHEWDSVTQKSIVTTRAVASRTLQYSKRAVVINSV